MKREKTYSTTCQACINNHWEWNACTMRGQYIEMRDIIYCKTQVLWLIENVLLTGVYPPKETGYGQAPLVQHSINNAGFPVEEIVAELSARLERTGTAGKLLVRQVILEEEYLEQESRDALNYICGNKRKYRSFSQWKSDREYKQKVRNFSKIVKKTS